MIKKLIKKAIGAVARFYHKIRSLRVVWLMINLPSIIRYKRNVPTLNEEQKRVVAALREDGIAITHVDKLFPPETFAELQKFALTRWEDADVKSQYERRDESRDGDKLKSKSFFLVDLWKGERVLDLSHPFTKFSLSDVVLNTVNTYMGMFVKFIDWRLQVTIPMPEGMRSYASQEWHRDPEDQQLVKVFLYLNDVDEAAGPFIYLKKSHYTGKWRHLFPQKPPRGSAGEDDKIPNQDRIVCTGKAGTLVFCDTSGLHRGGHAKSKNRFMYTTVFESPASVWPVIMKYPKHFPQLAYAIDNKVKAEPKFYNF